LLATITKVIKTISTIADTDKNTAEEKRQHSFLIYIGLFMSTGGIFWGSISLYSGLPFQASIPLGYALMTFFNFSYLYFSKDFQTVQAIQLFLSLILPFLFQLSLGGFVSSGAQVFWAITAILGAFTFKRNNTTIIWFVLYLVLVILSGLLDETIRDLHLVEIPTSISVLFFTINITAVSIIIFGLFYYFVGSERKYRTSLEENLENLKNAQDQLVESEKMSALGSLVAGVAHEVNTPLGISITAASIFKNEIKDLKDAVENNSLSKTALNEFIENISKTDDLLIKNLDRAAQLIRNFKKISVDQSSDNIREFELNIYIKEIVSTLSNEMNQHNVTLELALEEEDIKMHSYPGAIAQIIINLLQNCLLHGFDEKTKGHITLSTRISDSDIIITCEDDGKGVHKEIINKIFEPFITTKRNKGGTGLGLNITYNLVTQHLKGTIKLDTEYTKGARFIITLPKELVHENDSKHNYLI